MKPPPIHKRKHADRGSTAKRVTTAGDRARRRRRWTDAVAIVIVLLAVAALVAVIRAFACGFTADQPWMR